MFSFQSWVFAAWFYWRSRTGWHSQRLPASWSTYYVYVICEQIVSSLSALCLNPARITVFYTMKKCLKLV